MSLRSTVYCMSVMRSPCMVSVTSPHKMKPSPSLALLQLLNTFMATVGYLRLASALGAERFLGSHTAVVESNIYAYPVWLFMSFYRWT